MNSKTAAVAISIMAIADNVAADSLQVYFSNDSLNGFKLSDAYETHDMGLKYQTGDKYFDLNLAIVTPDMYVYRNQYREANRSYGELVSFTYGSRTTNRFYRLTSVGDFGLDRAQDFAHRVFRLQPVATINKLVQMPEKVHFGVGQTIELDTHSGNLGTITGYLGTDTQYIQFDKVWLKGGSTLFSYEIDSSLTYVHSDEIVSAPPINAEFRKLRPQVSFSISYQVAENVALRLSESVSMPTVKSDNNPFLVFSAGLEIDL